MRTKTVRVSQEFLDFCAKQNCCDRFHHDQQDKSRGKVITWKHFHWVCLGSMGSGLLGNLEAHLHQCVPEAEYQGRPYDRGSHSYVGERFCGNGQVWIITDLQVTLVPKHLKGERYVSSIS